MKRSPLLIHSAWALLAIGTYVAGTAQSPKTPAASRPDLVTGRPSARMSPANARKGEWVFQVAGWLRPYQDSGGIIPPARMKDAVRAALRNPDPVHATLYFAHLLEKLTPENADAVLRSIHENAGGDTGTLFVGLLAHAWGTLDGAAALAGLLSLNRRNMDNATSAAMAAWASRDREGAKSWLAKRGEVENPKEKQALTRGLVSGMARQDLPGALDYVMTFKEEERAVYGHLLAEQKMQEGVSTAADWALRLPEEGMRINAMETIGYQFIRGSARSHAMGRENRGPSRCS